MKIFLALVVCSLLMIAVFSCSNSTPKGSETITPPAGGKIIGDGASTTKLVAAWDKKHPEWTPILVEALKEHGQALLTTYPEGACGDRIPFYVALMSKLAEFESGFNPRATYTENFPGDDGKPQISAGVFQLSLDDAKYNAGCKFKTMEDLFDPEKNIRCAVFIANKWISKDLKLAAGSDSTSARGFARYWGPMRKPAKRDVVIAAARATCI